MRKSYPAIFYNDEGSVGVVVPDIKGCFTFGDDMTEALEMAKDVIEMMLVSFEDDNQEIPIPSKISEIIKRIEENKIEDIGEEYEVSYVAINTDEWRKSNGEKSVRKNVTIPEWLNNKAEKANINFSQVLQNALKAELNIA